MKRTALVFTLVFTCLCTVFGQNKFYRESGKSRIMSQAEFDNMTNVSTHRLISKFPDARTVTEIVNKTLMGKDTLCDVKIVLKFDGEKSIHLTNITSGNIFKKVGTKFPDFNLKSFDGKSYTLRNFKGKPMLVNYWFNTCAPCKAEMPALNKLKEKYGDKVHFVSITADTEKMAQSVLDDHPFHFLHLLEAYDLIGKLGLSGAPKNIFVDKNGVIRQVYEKVDDVFDPQTKTISHGDAKEFAEILDILISE